jgi:hypothetical protein
MSGGAKNKASSMRVAPRVIEESLRNIWDKLAPLPCSNEEEGRVFIMPAGIARI